MTITHKKLRIGTIQSTQNPGKIEDRKSDILLVNRTHNPVQWWLPFQWSGWNQTNNLCSIPPNNSVPRLGLQHCATSARLKYSFCAETFSCQKSFQKEAKNLDSNFRSQCIFSCPELFVFEQVNVAVFRDISTFTSHVFSSSSCNC